MPQLAQPGRLMGTPRRLHSGGEPPIGDTVTIGAITSGSNPRPIAGTITPTQPVTVTVFHSDGSVAVAGAAATVTGTTWSHPVTCPAGVGFYAEAHPTNDAGNIARSLAFNVWPVLSIDTVDDGPSPRIFTGTVTPTHAVTCEVRDAGNDLVVQPTACVVIGTAWSVELDVPPGLNLIAEATDTDGLARVNSNRFNVEDVATPPGGSWLHAATVSGDRAGYLGHGGNELPSLVMSFTAASDADEVRAIADPDNAGHYLLEHLADGSVMCSGRPPGGWGGPNCFWEPFIGSEGFRVSLIPDAPQTGPFRLQQAGTGLYMAESFWAGEGWSMAPTAASPTDGAVIIYQAETEQPTDTAVWDKGAVAQRPA